MKKSRHSKATKKFISALTDAERKAKYTPRKYRSSETRSQGVIDEMEAKQVEQDFNRIFSRHLGGQNVVLQPEQKVVLKPHYNLEKSLEALEPLAQQIQSHPAVRQATGMRCGPGAKSILADIVDETIGKQERIPINMALDELYARVRALEDRIGD